MNSVSLGSRYSGYVRQVLYVLYVPYVRYLRFAGVKADHFWQKLLLGGAIQICLKPVLPVFVCGLRQRDIQRIGGALHVCQKLAVRVVATKKAIEKFKHCVRACA